VYNHARHKILVLSQDIHGVLSSKFQLKPGETNDKEQKMTKITQTKRAALLATLIAGLTACGESEKATPTPPPAPAVQLTVGGTVSGLAGGEVILQLNNTEELTVKADGKFKFPKPLTKGGAYSVTVKTAPTLPVKQTCAVGQGSGNIAAAPVSNVSVTCLTNTYAVGGKVSGLAAKSKGLVLELKGGNEANVTKNGNFVFPDTRLPDGSDYNVSIKSTPAGQKCIIEAIATAPDSDTMNIVAVTCSKKGGRK
jgi:hypothetical protein